MILTWDETGIIVEPCVVLIISVVKTTWCGDNHESQSNACNPFPMHSGFDQFLVLVLPSFMINEHVTLLKYDSFNMTKALYDLLWCEG